MHGAAKRIALSVGWLPPEGKKMPYWHFEDEATYFFWQGGDSQSWVPEPMGFFSSADWAEVLMNRMAEDGVRMVLAIGRTPPWTATA